MFCKQIQASGQNQYLNSACYFNGYDYVVRASIVYLQRICNVTYHINSSSYSFRVNILCVFSGALLKNVI